MERRTARSRPAPTTSSVSAAPNQPTPAPVTASTHCRVRISAGSATMNALSALAHEPRAPRKTLPQIIRPTETARPPHTPPLGRPERNARDLRWRKSATRDVPRVKNNPAGTMSEISTSSARSPIDRYGLAASVSQSAAHNNAYGPNAGSSRATDGRPCDLPSSTRASASSSARALGHRCAGSRARQRMTIAASAGGTSGAAVTRSGGALVVRRCIAVP